MEVACSSSQKDDWSIYQALVKHQLLWFFSGNNLQLLTIYWTVTSSNILEQNWNILGHLGTIVEPWSILRSTVYHLLNFQGSIQFSIQSPSYQGLCLVFTQFSTLARYLVAYGLAMVGCPKIVDFHRENGSINDETGILVYSDQYVQWNL
jgi:hypothetical protein